jgi:hypothetical protein
MPMRCAVGTLPGGHVHQTKLEQTLKAIRNLSQVLQTQYCTLRISDTTVLEPPCSGMHKLGRKIIGVL